MVLVHRLHPVGPGAGSGRAGTAVRGHHGNQVPVPGERGEAGLLAVEQEGVSVDDVDLTEAIMELQTQEVALEAALEALARVRRASLVDFLR